VESFSCPDVLSGGQKTRILGKEYDADNPEKQRQILWKQEYLHTGTAIMGVLSSSKIIMPGNAIKGVSCTSSGMNRKICTSDHYQLSYSFFHFL
jgi:hypothetical protein